MLNLSDYINLIHEFCKHIKNDFENNDKMFFAVEESAVQSLNRNRMKLIFSRRRKNHI